MAVIYLSCLDFQCVIECMDTGMVLNCKNSDGVNMELEDRLCLRMFYIGLRSDFKLCIELSIFCIVELKTFTHLPVP